MALLTAVAHRGRCDRSASPSSPFAPYLASQASTVLRALVDTQTRVVGPSCIITALRIELA
jgi:hypothetical protein